jgi:hypothetical protein
MSTDLMIGGMFGPAKIRMVSQTGLVSGRSFGKENNRQQVTRKTPTMVTKMRDSQQERMKPGTGQHKRVNVGPVDSLVQGGGGGC